MERVSVPCMTSQMADFHLCALLHATLRQVLKKMDSPHLLTELSDNIKNTEALFAESKPSSY